MIVFDLMCAGQHRFEGWFASAEDFASQKARAIVSCPVCGTAEIERVPSTSRINMGAVEVRPTARTDAALEGRDAHAVAEILKARILDLVLANTEDVGAEFPAEARRIHYGDSAARAIRGQASQEEHDSLVEEGVPVARLPVPPRKSWN